MTRSKEGILRALEEGRRRGYSLPGDQRVLDKIRKTEGDKGIEAIMKVANQRNIAEQKAIEQQEKEFIKTPEGQIQKKQRELAEREQLAADVGLGAEATSWSSLLIPTPTLRPLRSGRWTTWKAQEEESPRLTRLQT